MESSVKQRLTEYLQYKKVNMSEFARRINVSSAYVSSMRQSIQPDKIKRIALNFPDLNTAWLLTGEGEMLKGTELSQVVKSELESETVRMLLAELVEQRKTIARLTAIIDRLTGMNEGKNDGRSKAV